MATLDPIRESLPGENGQPVGLQDGWAAPVERLALQHAPEGAISLNVKGRRLAGPLQGFGQLWQKTYRVRLAGAAVTPAQVIQGWKENFGRFWPDNATFYPPFQGLNPGDVALFDATGPGGIPLMSTGVMVLYADEESFTFINPEGHLFAGWVTFSAHEQDEAIVAQVQLLIRANDPFYEIGFRLGILHKVEDQIWHHTLTSLARHFGVTGQVSQEVSCLDARVQWSQAGNLWKNAGMHTALYVAAAPWRWLKSRLPRLLGASA
jgi:hypothetical protein